MKAHIIFEKKGAPPYRPFNDCLNRKHCFHYGDICLACERHKNRNKCSACGLYNLLFGLLQEECPKLSKAPLVCNGCDLLNSAPLRKDSIKLFPRKKSMNWCRGESRSGFNLCEDELKQLDSVISPLLKNGQSIHHILANNQDKISCCEKTAYIYADSGLFSARNIDMPRKVRFKPRKKKVSPSQS